MIRVMKYYCMMTNHCFMGFGCPRPGVIQRKNKSEKNSRSNKFAVAGITLSFAMLLLTSVIPLDKWYRVYVSLFCSVCTVYTI